MAKIMIVDDDPEISNLLQITMESLGHTIKICDNGREVMDSLKEFKPDLMILDVMLPGVDGYSIATSISQDESLSKIPIIVLSALEPSRSLFVKFNQVVAFLTKPFNTDDLFEAVKNALEKKDL
ncbi:MAG: response regulator [Elusimicrobiales bacterium]|nr:response regulator [Elusimicrobiales bacterium]HOL62115.1 response regulator [Elusimicrobiales bacterium]HPO94702.1 response regulator [Elusimicrobiales bacterium]